MNRYRKFIAVAVLVAIVVLAVSPAAAKVTVVFLSAGDSGQSAIEERLTRKVNEYEGQHRLVSHPSGVEELLTRKVNEYEGQH